MKNRNILSLCILLFILSAVLGFISFQSVEEKLIPVLKDVVYAGIISESKFQTALNIFVRNFITTIILVGAGFTILVPILIISSNGFLFGFVLKFAMEENLGPVTFIKAVIPHSLFELPAFFISAAVGLRIGVTILSPKEKRKKEIILRVKEASLIYLTVVIPLLIIAAFVEAFITAALVL